MQTIRRGDGLWVGRAELAPRDPVTAGATGDWTIRYTAGRYGVDDGGALKLSWRFASDWADPQLTDPAAPNYVRITSDADAVLAARYEPRGNVRPWMKTILVRVTDGFLRPGQRLTLAFERSRSQTFVEHRFQWRLFIDCFGADVYEEVEEDLSFPIVSGPVSRLVAVAPSQAGVGEPSWLFVRAEDAWGNPADGYRGTVLLDAAVEGLPSAYAFTAADGGARRFDGLRARQAGSFALAARDLDLGLRAYSNPTEVAPSQSVLKPFWGDLHGQSGETIGTNTVEDYFRFARDKAGIDFSCHQGNDFQVTPAIWEEIKRQTKAFHEPGRFVTFLGVEWSAITAAGGDHNVIYPGDDGQLHRSSHWQVDERDDLQTDAYPVTELYKAFRGQDVILLPHIGGRRTDLRWHDPALEPLIEIHSSWGTFEWLLDEALERGYTVGFAAGSDDHKGRPGAAYPGAGQFGVLGGLTCLYARELTREALWEAMRARRSSCSTGERIVARLRMGEHWMGEEVTTLGQIEAFVAGTDELEEIAVKRGTETVYRHELAPFEPGDRVRIAWTGARILDRNRQQIWDGSLRVEAARILDAQDYSIDTPTEGIQAWDSASVRWRSRTAGDEDGVVLRLDDARGGVLHFESPPLSFVLDLAELERSRTFNAGGIRRQVVVSRLSEAAAPRTASFTWRAPDAGGGAYYLRVKQRNGALAWTSPIYVRSKP